MSKTNLGNRLKANFSTKMVQAKKTKGKKHKGSLASQAIKVDTKSEDRRKKDTKYLKK